MNVATYSTRRTPLHSVDPRVKILLLFAYSITLFCIRSWIGMGVCLAVFAVGAVLGRLPFAPAIRQLVPLWVILLVTLVVNSFSFDVFHLAQTAGLGGVSAGVLSSLKPVALCGSFGFVPAGFARGCYYVLRIALLALASVLLTTTTAPTEISRSLDQFLRPLARFKIPTHDIATIVSIALRFIPVTFDEFAAVRRAQEARGAMFSNGSLTQRLRAWQTVFVPLFVGLFRRADVLALAMDARCYGAGEPTHLNESTFTFASWATLTVGLVFCLAVSLFF